MTPAYKFEAVLVWKLDRRGTSVPICVRTIQELVSLGIRLLRCRESPMPRFILHLFAAFAEMERETIRERVRVGVGNANAKGTRLGRPQRVSGTTRYFRLRNQEMNSRNLAKTLNLRMSTVIDACRPCSENPPSE